MPDISAARPVAGQPIETAWGQQVHDAVEATVTSQHGNANVAFSGASVASITVGHSSVAAGAARLATSRARGYTIAIESVTATSFEIVVTAPSAHTGDIGVDWAVIGTLG